MSTAQNDSQLSPASSKRGPAPAPPGGANGLAALPAGGERRLRARLARRLEHRRSEDRQTAADVRLAEERRRIAAEVHDLIMQDLSFALATARSIEHDPRLAFERVSDAVDAGERALRSARELVSGLGSRDLEPVAEAVEASVRAAARQTPLTFDARVPAHARPDQLTLDALVHIGREAVTNAIKHAGSGYVEVSLIHDEEWRLRVRDDGCGFDAGFGLQSMRRAVLALGGSLSVRSAAGEGTAVEAVLP